MDIYDRGELIKTLRTERKITQKQLAELLGVSEATVCKYEANTSTPPFETMRSIAAIFNISMDTLCGMKHQGTLSVHGLTEAQIKSLEALANAYRVKGMQVGNKLTYDQYAVLGQIYSELVK